MSSLLLGEGRRGLWDRLPQEIQSLIFGVLIDDGYPLSKLVTVSRLWQDHLEPHIFSRIRVTPSRTITFDSMTHRNKTLVHYIWFCLELDKYDCSSCAPSSRDLDYDEVTERITITDTEHCPITTAFEHLFSALSTWDHRGNLTLDISFYSPSDSEHWFPYLTVMPDMLPGQGLDQIAPANVRDSQHPWPPDSRAVDQLRSAMYKIFHVIMDEGSFDSEELEFDWWGQLPSVPVVDRLLLRQQTRRRWRPIALGHMLARLPNLRELYYEPWREFDFSQRITDRDYRSLIYSTSLWNRSLERIVVFENFNEQYPLIHQRFQNGEDIANCDSIRKSSPMVNRAFVLASVNLHHLAASFIADAAYFFTVDPCLEWPNLISLTLTARTLAPEQDPNDMVTVLRDAAAAAVNMPRLETMEIWNGGKGLAALFKCQISRKAYQATITWRGTWRWAMKGQIIKAWGAVVLQDDFWRLEVVEELLDKETIKSHADAIEHLKLRDVIRPISLHQIKLEQKALEGIPTVRVED